MSATSAARPWDPIAQTSSAPLHSGAEHQSDVETPKAHDSYLHEALFWKGEADFLASTVPFIREGLAAGQPVMVAVIVPRIIALRVALGTDADRVRFVDMAELGRNPALIIAGWSEFVEETGVNGQPVRGIGESIWSGRHPAEVVECQLHEALLNLAVEPHTPLWLMCPYDVVGLAPDVVTQAQFSHPVLVEGEGRRESAHYAGSHHVETIFESDLPAAAGVVASRRVFGHNDLQEVREDVNARARGAGLSVGRSAALAHAVHEVATNSVQHGRGRRTLLIWLEKDSLVCEVHDYGRITDPMSGRRPSAWEDETGRGLWIANQLCDLVQVRSSAAGTTIRLRIWI